MQPFNKYYPPDWEPEKGSVNKFVGKHPLGDRARKIDQGILIVRFELPYNIWCEGCGKHVGKGVRYNAEKKKVGNYYSTPIYSFRMKCHLCDNWIEIQTDPKNSEYVVVSGARQKVETWEPEDTETIRLKESNDDIIKAKTTEFADHLLEKAVKRKLEISTSSIFNKNNKKLISSSSLSSKSKKYKSIFDNSNSKVAQLSAVVTVNTKLKTDPFLKDNDWNNSKNGGSNNNDNNNNSSKEIQNDLIVIKKKDNKKSSNNNNIEEKSKTVENQQQQQIDNSNNSEGINYCCYLIL
ncbi:264_t:CDS:2 [Entrophospora sp. SA101]|nr:264_t:CDS:2 [Entrophospora sp. SA101]CAJ0827421.1 939_t:CDS:2 [Entrophospora sp. SA101]CAJ0882000.1 2214_t:CDS:2 [Entrophospora sp. SA101]